MHLDLGKEGRGNDNFCAYWPGVPKTALRDVLESCIPTNMSPRLKRARPGQKLVDALESWKYEHSFLEHPDSSKDRKGFEPLGLQGTSDLLKEKNSLKSKLLIHLLMAFRFLFGELLFGGGGR